MTEVTGLRSPSGHPRYAAAVRFLLIYLLLLFSVCVQSSAQRPAQSPAQSSAALWRVIARDQGIDLSVMPRQLMVR